MLQNDEPNNIELAELATKDDDQLKSPDSLSMALNDKSPDYVNARDALPMQIEELPSAIANPSKAEDQLPKTMQIEELPSAVTNPSEAEDQLPKIMQIEELPSAIANLSEAENQLPKIIPTERKMLANRLAKVVHCNNRNSIANINEKVTILTIGHCRSN